jgi:hypothetical protein
MDRVLEPAVTRMFTRYQLSLQRLFRAYSGLDSRLGYTNTLVTWQLLQRADCRLQRVDLMRFVQDKRVVPGLLSKPRFELLLTQLHLSPHQQIHYR